MLRDNSPHMKYIPNVKKFFLIATFIFISIRVNSQIIHPDSLVGCYSGLCYFKYDSDTSWTITPCYKYISAIDTSNCTFYDSGRQYFITDNYGYCNFFPSNYYTKFYAGDSMEIVYNHIQRPPPDWRYFSIHDYFKKDQNCATSIAENKVELNLTIFPNPFFISTTLQTSYNFKNATLLVYDLMGNIVKQINNVNGKEIILFRDNLSYGMYLFQISEDNKIFVRDKILITDK